MSGRTSLVTGGCGFIGSALVRHLTENTSDKIVVADALTYAGNPLNIASVPAQRIDIEEVDVANQDAMLSVLRRHRPDRIFHLAAETHVDRSIEGPNQFFQTNVLGTLSLLEAIRDQQEERDLHLVHISTDEVYGELGDIGRFTESDAYRPRSPYAASKASADHVVAAWRNTYGLSATIVNLSNNYGPFQFPEKLIPLMTIRGLQRNPMPVYGRGLQRREWLFVEDAARALVLVADSAPSNQTYNIGSGIELANIDVVLAIADILDEISPDKTSRRELVTFVEDRPGHDFRYALDSSKAREELGWIPTVDFQTGLRQTVEWFVAHRDWWEPTLLADYDTSRLGLISPR